MARSRKPKPGAPYYLPPYEYRTAVNFCLQYREWEAELETVTGLHGVDNDGMPHGTETSDPTFRDAVRRAGISAKMDLIEDCVRDTDPVLFPWLLEAVTNERATYRYLVEEHGLPVSINTWTVKKREVYWRVSRRI